MGSRMVQGCIYGVLTNCILVSWCTTLTVCSFNLLSLDITFFYALVFTSVCLSVTASMHLWDFDNYFKNLNKSVF